MSSRIGGDQAVKEALRTIGTLFEPGDVIEIRALEVGRTPDRAGSTHAGYFNFENSKEMATAIRSVDGKAEGIYVVLNRFNPQLLARSINHLKVKPKNTTTDADIMEWRWLYIDADASRPAGISATDAEHKAAIQRTLEIQEFLASLGWPEPVRGDSGNGGHLLYRLPQLDLKRAAHLVKSCLRALHGRFSDEKVKVDEATATAARLCKLYATMARKGDSTVERPHRRSALLEVPEKIEQVPLEALEALASEAKIERPLDRTQKSSAPTGRNFDIDHWLAQSGLDIAKGPEPYDGGSRWLLRHCIFNSEHQKPAIIQLANGACVYKCLHKSCEGNDWKVFRRRVDPSYTGDDFFVRAESSKQDTAGDIPFRITDLSQLDSVWALEMKLDWCVEGMIPQGSVNIICSESGTGKTWLAYYIAGCIAHGLPVLGRRVNHLKVLYLDGENALYVVKQRLRDLGISETADLQVWGGWSPSPPEGPACELITDFARQHKGLIIFDSLIEFHPGSEQSSTETRAFMRYFRALANLGATVIVLHHSGKAETSKLYRGSSDIKAAVDTAYLLESADKESNRLGKLTLKHFKNRVAPGENFGLEFRHGEGFFACDLPSPARTTEEVIEEILKAHPRSNQKRIVGLGCAEGCSKAQIERSLKTDLWLKVKGPNNSILYSLPESDDSDPEVES